MTKQFSKYFLFTFIICVTVSCKEELKDYSTLSNETKHIHKALKVLTDAMIHDIFSPPVASRIYSYSSMAAYEAGRHQDSTYTSLFGQIKHMPTIPAPEAGQGYCWSLAAIVAYNNTARKFIFLEDSVVNFNTKVLKEYQDLGLPKDVFDRSVAYGTQVSDVIKKWADGDNYAQTRSFPKFNVTSEEGRWTPTPPAYMDAVEPHWNDIRPYTLDSAAQFKPSPPTPFSKDKKSQFYKEAEEVYLTGKNQTKEQNEIANFWDCNPYKVNVIGHIMHASKKISPGGHWMGITGIASRTAKAGLAKSLASYAIVSIGLMDGFISCWDEKYRSNLIRPESYINSNIDPNWIPTLQTPPFPEYTSGHSVVSGASSTILTSLYGDNFKFSDDTEVDYGLPIKDFPSFDFAAQQASLSRMYGGIHYRPAIENGVKQGQAVGANVLAKIKLTK
jgi:hypothetical protein